MKANDGYVTKISHGGVTFYNGTNSTIRMDSEYVEITLYGNYFTVDATFWLYNTGPTKTAKVGFPHKGGYTGVTNIDSQWIEEFNADISYAVSDFSTRVNDSQVPFKTFQKLDRKLRVDEKLILNTPKEIVRWWQKKGKSRNKEEMSGICSDKWLQWYVKSVHFPANTTVKTSVAYKSFYSNYNNNDDTVAMGGTYIFGSGKSWKGNRQKSVFKIVKVDEDSSAIPIELPSKYNTNQVVQRTQLHNGELLEFHNYKPDATDEIHFFFNEMGVDE